MGEPEFCRPPSGRFQSGEPPRGESSRRGPPRSKSQWSEDSSGRTLKAATLRGANLSKGVCGDTTFANVDLSETKASDSLEHRGPSTLGIDTLVLSKGQIPEIFLRGCGVPEYLIENQQSVIHSMERIQFSSCFISYSTDDEQFARRLHSKMQDHGLRVWFRAGRRPGWQRTQQMDEAIRVYDKLLLILSANSIDSKWVRDEIRRARKSEVREGRRKLFPVRLMDYEDLLPWENFYADLGEDLAEEVREYFIPDFSNWKVPDAFDAAFARLLKDLKRDVDPTNPPASLTPVGAH